MIRWFHKGIIFIAIYTLFWKSPMRRFEYKDAKSSKFWEVETKGKTLHVTFGKIGTAGQSKPKAFSTADKANAEMEKLIREKTGKGYVEVGGKTVKVAKPVAVKMIDAGYAGAGLSKAEKKAKAEKVLMMFANGQWELARGILESAKDEHWLFEELLKGCKIEDGKIKPSPLVNKYFENLKDQWGNSSNNAEMVILGVMLEAPKKTMKMYNLETKSIESVYCIPYLNNLEYFGYICESYPKIKYWNVRPTGDADDVETMSDSAAKLLSHWEMESVGFDNLTNLSDKAINYLCNMTPFYLDLPALKNLSGAAAKSFVKLLARGTNRVSLDGLESISDEAVIFLSKGYYYYEKSKYPIFDDNGDSLNIPEKLQKIIEKFKEKQPKKK